MKKFFGVFVLALIVLMITEPAFAFWSKKKAGVEYLILDAMMSLAQHGATMGARAAALEVSPNYDHSLHPPEPFNKDTLFVKSVASFADGASWIVNSEALEMVSNEIGLPIFRHVSGMGVAREAANKVGQSQNPDTWGPDVIIHLTKEEAQKAIQQGVGEEEIGKAAAKVAWDWILKHEQKIRNAVILRLHKYFPRSLVKGDYSSAKLIETLKNPMKEAHFKDLVPSAQDFYRASVKKIESKLD